MDADVVVIGAGVVGLAVAAELAEAGARVIVLERRTRVGSETSSRSSEVVHAGLHGGVGWLKTELCIEGNRDIWRMARDHGLPARRTGKLVVATDSEELAALEALARRAGGWGVPGIEVIDGAEAMGLEPRIRCLAAIRSPSTGIVDSHALTRHFEDRARAKGMDLALETTVVGLERASRGGYEVHTVGAGGERFVLHGAGVVNAAGLEADRVAALAGLDEPSDRIHAVRGRYFVLRPARAAGIGRLIYPLPPRDGAGLGVHLTVDLAGRARLGPDAEERPRPAPGEEHDYRVDEGLAPAFARAVSRFLPGVEAEDLSPDQAGIRPALARPGEPRRDFVVREESERGWPGFVNLIGIDSPGLTASPALARRVRGLLADPLGISSSP